MSILAWIVFGGLAGLVAGLLTGGGGGIIYDIIVGIAGAFLGGLLMTLIGQTGVTGWNWRSFAVAVVGAVVLLVCPACGTGTRKSLKAAPLEAGRFNGPAGPPRALVGLDVCKDATMAFFVGNSRRCCSGAAERWPGLAGVVARGCRLGRNPRG